MDTKQLSDNYIYEVFRVIEGRPLYLEEHHDRMIESMAIQGVTAPEDIADYARFAQSIETFIETAGIKNDNVKIIVAGDEAVRLDYMVMGAKYPSPDMYRTGVRTMTLRSMRDNPHAKVNNQSLRDYTNQLIAENGLFEVILVDTEGNITEGSRSNIFFIRDGVIYTSSSEGVLLGVTRQKVIEISEANSIDVVERDIEVGSVCDYDAAFISGTSPRILPIAQIDSFEFDVKDETLRRLMKLYDEDICKSIGRNVNV